MIGRLYKEYRVMRRMVPSNGARGYLRFRFRRLMGNAEPVAVSMAGWDMHLRPTGPDMAVVESSRAEFGILRHIYSSDTEGVIVDAGGFVGSASLAFAEMYPNARIIAVEASSANAELLRKDVAHLANVEVIHAALVADGGPETLRLRDRDTGAWGFSVAAAGDEKHLESVPSLAISQLLERIGDARILICKMDIEGAETALFTPDAEWLKRTNVLMVELHERIVPGCEAAFFAANVGRCVLSTDGEKYISIGPEVFSEV